MLEPLFIGKSTSLQPVAVLLAIMLWGSVWGVTGMVLAVPMTAVMRIYLAHIAHPLPRYFAAVLAGAPDDECRPEETPESTAEVEAPPLQGCGSAGSPDQGHGMIQLAHLRS